MGIGAPKEKSTSSPKAGPPVATSGLAPLNRTNPAQPATIVEGPAGESLVREGQKGDTYVLKCKIPWNATVPAPQKRYLHRDDVYSHFTISGGPTTVVFPLSDSVRALLQAEQIPERDLCTDFYPAANFCIAWSQICLVC